MSYALDLTDYGITKERFAELKAFCVQYEQRKKKAADIAGLRSMTINAAPLGNGGVGKPTQTAAIKRALLLEQNRVIEEAAKSVDGGVWYAALIQSACYGKSWDRLLASAIMPTHNRNAYFNARRGFFVALDRLIDERWSGES